MKTHTQHTPGPSFLWPSALPLRIEENSEGYFEVWTAKNEAPGSLNNAIVATTQFAAEARLFSAAPELLSALETLCADAEDHLESVGKTYPKAMLTLALIDNARQAIARAKGGHHEN